MEDKSITEKKHFKLRVYQRLGVWIDDKQVKLIVDEIRFGQSILWFKQSNRVSIYELDLKSIIKSTENALVVYDKQRHMPVTVLTKDQIV